MNRELLRLLDSVRADATSGRALRWDDVLIVQNTGPVAGAARPEGDFTWNRGFNFVLLNRDGAPTHYCKCRTVPNEQMAVETVILEALGADRLIRHLVPYASAAQGEHLQLQISTYLPGVPFSEVIGQLSEQEWLAATRHILESADAVSARAIAVVPQLHDAGSTPLMLDEAARPHLEYLASVGMYPEHLDALTGALHRAGEVRGWPQHGDLWPGNVLWDRGAPRLIDFEIFGEIHVPLYDVLHWLRVCFGFRPDAVSPDRPRLAWVDALAHDTPAVRKSRALISMSARRRRLNSRGTVGALVYYVVDIAARIHRRGTAGAAPSRMLSEVERLAELLLEGVPLEQRLLGPQ
jgi:hypothetical protein